MRFIYEDLEIANLDLSEFSNSNLYSKIIFKNETLLKRIRSSISTDYEFEVQKNLILHDDEDFILWSSNIIFLNRDYQKIFLEKLVHSHGSFKWSNNEGCIYKGTKYDLENSKYINYKLEENLIQLSDFNSFQKLLETNYDTRHFNEIKKSFNSYVKESPNVSKIENEFKYLNTIPKNLKPYYISVSAFKKSKHEASYSMPKINYLDVSRRHINGTITKKEASKFFERLEDYFEDIMSLGIEKTGKEFSFIFNKTKEREKILKSTNFFEKINQIFLFTQENQSLSNSFQELERLLIIKENTINRSGSVISHGDLCLSNILSSKNFGDLIFIDPMGGTLEESKKSIYYDFAKLSHSIIGNYDYIVHGLANFDFNSDLEVSITYSKEQNQHLISCFLKLLDKFEIDLGLVRLIEASLFLSMLPLHNDNLMRSAMLALRGKEILSEIKADNLI